MINIYSVNFFSMLRYINMGGGLMQLVAYGAQDIYLTGNPQITFFKVVYRRHTNFSMEAIKQTFNGTPDFGNNVSATISRNGDLVYRMYLEHTAKFKQIQTAVSLLRNIGLCERYGDSLIKECEIEIGGQNIDKHTSMWNRVYSDLTQFNPSGYFGGENKLASADGGFIDGTTGTLYQLMTGNGIGINSELASSNNDFGCHGPFQTSGSVNGFLYTENAKDLDPGEANVDIGTIFLPLNFWFCRNPGLALPLIALQYHEVKVKMTFESLTNLARPSSGANFTSPLDGDTNCETSDLNFNLWCDYIYLDTDERRRFAQVSHEYLIEQLQYSENSISSASPKIDIDFNHPVKELIWCIRNETAGAAGGRCQPMTSSNGDPTCAPVSLDKMGGNWQLQLNGHDRFQERDTGYFTRTQVWQHHTGCGGISTMGNKDTDLGSEEARTFDASIAVYSFALKPEEHQPSGTCNFSRIDNAQLIGKALTTEIQSGSTPMIIGGDGTNSVKLTIFAVNYNVLRIMSGMGGLAYSN
jgi:hypothetical protein